MADNIGDLASVFGSSVGVEPTDGQSWRVERILFSKRAMSGFASSMALREVPLQEHAVASYILAHGEQHGAGSTSPEAPGNIK